jgi:hypothetical protein
MARYGKIIFEKEDNYQKQTYRNRCYIYGANGKQLLTVPVIHTRGSGHRKTIEVKIDNSFDWQKLHLRSLQTAYRSSPFFEFYEDDLLPLFQKRFDFLTDLNLETDTLISELIGLEVSKEFTKVYSEEYHDDFRLFVNAKSKNEFHLKKYHQVFIEKHGFLSNLSILDLLFNEGTSALNYLEDQVFVTA